MTSSHLAPSLFSCPYTSIRGTPRATSPERAWLSRFSLSLSPRGAWLSRFSLFFLATWRELSLVSLCCVALSLSRSTSSASLALSRRSLDQSFLGHLHVPISRLVSPRLASPHLPLARLVSQLLAPSRVVSLSENDCFKCTVITGPTNV